MVRSATHEIEERFKSLKNDPEFRRNVDDNIAAYCQKVADDEIARWNRTRKELCITDEMLYGPRPDMSSAPVNPLESPRRSQKKITLDDGTEIDLTECGCSSVDLMPGRDY